MKNLKKCISLSLVVGFLWFGNLIANGQRLNQGVLITSGQSQDVLITVDNSTKITNPLVDKNPPINTNTPSVKTVIYSQVVTNWDSVINTTSATWEWNSGGPTGVHTTYFTNGSPTSYTGVITSNNFLNVYYDNKLITSKMLDTKKIGEINITWEQMTIFHTNIVSYP